jgi:hypothetical protein
MEMDQAYCDVIIQRYEQFTGKKAERIAAAPSTEKTSTEEAEVGEGVN